MHCAPGIKQRSTDFIFLNAQCSRGDDTFGEGSCEDKCIFLVVFGDGVLLVVAFAADGV